MTPNRAEIAKCYEPVIRSDSQIRTNRKDLIGGPGEGLCEWFGKLTVANLAVWEKFHPCALLKVSSPSRTRP